MKEVTHFHKSSVLSKIGIIVGFCMLACLMISNSLAANKTWARYEINAKRIGVDPADKDALPRSREFIRLDSTYYVGWMYEGIYKSERSSDYLGFKLSIIPLRKALFLIEKDYQKNIQNLFSSLDYYQENMLLFNDFYLIVNTLISSYKNIEMPDSAMVLYDKLEQYHFQRDYFKVHLGRAWLYHRGRFYTSDKYKFLKNSIAENEKIAYKECYKQIELIKKNKSKNDEWFGYGHSESDLMSVYHYLALLHDYNENYDSSHFYYDRLIDGGRISWNNYANMQHMLGEFSEALESYSKHRHYGNFTLYEPDYYVPMIYVYGGHTKNAINMMHEKIEEYGSVPGFGWYNIALARAYLYDGQLDSSEFFLIKASNFKELHIGTTLTQSQYEFTINMLRLQVLEKKVALIKFLDKGWWYSLSAIYNICALKLEKLLLEFALVNALSNNPERDRLVYQLFCSEATISFDESMYLLKDFSLAFFEEKYKNYTLFDRRTKINRYFRLFSAKFLYEQGNEDEAITATKSLIAETMPMKNDNSNRSDKADLRYEKIYAYRLFEMLSMAGDEDNNFENYKLKCFELYPQLMLFSGITMKLNITFKGLEDDSEIQKIKDDFNNCNIDITDDPKAPKALIEFSKKGNTYQALYLILKEDNGQQKGGEKIIFKKANNIGQELAMRMFSKGGAVKY